MWKELDKLHDTLTEIERAFYFMAVHERELQSYGLRYVSKQFDLNELLPLLDEFPIQLVSCQKIIDIVDKRKSDQLDNLLKETKLEDLITRFSIKLRISENQRTLFNPISSLLTMIGIIFRRAITNDLFSKEDISMEGVLSAIARIKSLLTISSNHIKELIKNDDEIFKPSNVHITKIIVEIDAAISDVQQSNTLPLDQQAKLIEYLIEAKTELAKKEPSWRKVIGALVISATLLGGAAVAPEAAENINKAVSYILGTSVPMHYDHQLKLPASKPNIDDGPETYAI